MIIRRAEYVQVIFFRKNCFAVSSKAFFREHRESTQGTGLLFFCSVGGKKGSETHLQHFSNPAIGIIKLKICPEHRILMCW